MASATRSALAFDPRLRQRQVVAVDALGAAGERRVVGVADEPHGDVLPVPQVEERLADLPGELFGDGSGLVFVAQRHHEVLDARPPLMPFPVAQLADGLHAADLDALDVGGDDDLFVPEGVPHLVVPDLHLDAAIERPALFGLVRGDRLCIAGPLVGDRLGRQSQRRLEVLGHLAGALPGEALIVTEDPGQLRGETLRVGVPDEVNADVSAVAHALEDPGEQVDVAGRDLRHTRFEADRRNDVLQLDGVEFLADHLLDLQTIAPFAVEQIRVLGPFPQWQVGGEMPLDRLARLVLLDLSGERRDGHQEEPGNQQQMEVLAHTVHLPSAAPVLGRPGGPPRRQKISGSMVSS
jgi:hypothetical protein